MTGDLKKRPTAPLIDLVDSDRPITYGILKPGPDVHDGVPYVRVVDMKGGSVSASTVRRTTHDIASKYQRSRLKKGDVLLSIRGHVGRTAVVGRDLDGANITQDTARLAPNRKVDGRYLFWVFASPDTQRWMARRTKGVAVQGINLGDIKELPIPLPPLAEQKRIANILDKADAIRRKRQEVSDTYSKLAAAIFHDMFRDELTSAERFELNEATLELRYGTSSKSGEQGLPALRIPNVVRGVVDTREIKTVAVTDAEREKLTLKSGDILFVRTNGNPGYVGRSAVFDPTAFYGTSFSGDDVIFASYLIRGRFDNTKLRPTFLQAFLQTPLGRRLLRRKSRTSAGQFNINTKGIRSLPIPRVSLEKQIAFESTVGALRPACVNYEECLSTATTLFDSLVQRAFRGEL